jgi:hypothetical protein
MHSTPEIAPKSLRFGLLCNSLTLEKWQADTIKSLLEGGMQLHLLVINNNQSLNVSFRKKVLHYNYRRLLFNLWSRFVFRPESKKPTDITTIIGDCNQIRCTTRTIGIANVFENQTIELIKQEKLDFLLRFGFNIIKGEILNSAKNGVWSFHHDDEDVVRGGPPGFWEVFKPHDTNGVMLQKLTDSLDKGLILKKIHYRTIKHSYKANLNQLYFGSTFLPLSICRDIINGCHIEMPSTSKAKIIHPPSNISMIQFILKMVFRRIQFHLKMLFYQEDWIAGIIHQSGQSFIADSAQNTLPEKIHWLNKTGSSCYTADPFVIDFQDDTFVFFELYDYKKCKGVISMVKASENFRIYHEVLSENSHFSFPFVFELNQTLYCIPECFESNGIQLYHFDIQSNKFTFVKTLLDNIQAIDPVLFEHDGLWWLFFSLKNQPSVHLFAYYSDEPFGQYQAHANNPVKSSIFSSRSAGKPFIFNGKLIRPSQDCGKDYGMAVVLNEIVELNIKSFKEVSFQSLKPHQNWKFNQGMHTFNSSAEHTVVDAKSFTFIWAGFKNELLSKLKFRRT